jgi:hypothetical protein
MKKVSILILIFAVLPVIANAKSQSFDEFWKNIQKTKVDKTQLTQHCDDFLKDGDFKISKEEFLTNDIVINTFAKWIPKLTKGNKYSAKIKNNTKTFKDNSFAETTFYKYGSGTNFESENGFYILRIANRTAIYETDWKDENYDIEICFGLRNGIFKIVGFSYKIIK